MVAGDEGQVLPLEGDCYPAAQFPILQKGTMKTGGGQRTVGNLVAQATSEGVVSHLFLQFLIEFCL